VYCKSSRGKNLLISGDIEASQEAELLKIYAETLQADILVAPHHGSLTSSSTEFVKAVNPVAVIFTTGYLNRWGFPRQKVLDRYQQMGSEIYQTDQHGAIVIHCDFNNCSLNRYRQMKPRLWY